MQRHDRPDASAISAALAERIEALALQLLGPTTSRSRFEWRWRGKGSLGVHVAGPKRGRFFDNEAGVHGDALDLVRHTRGGSLADAFRWALGWLGEGGVARTSPTAERPPRATSGGAAASADKAAWSAAKAAELLGQSAPTAGTLVERYLASRGLELPPDAPLRFHPRCWRNPENGPHGPAMLAPMTDPATGAWVGTHVTYLRPDGAGKAEGPSPKIKLGNAGVIRLVPDEDVTLHLGIGEGIETCLHVMQRYGWRPVWAAGDANGIRGFPVLAGIECLTVWADSDDGGTCLNAARECLERWEAAGREARVAPAPAGKDFGDLGGRAA